MKKNDHNHDWCVHKLIEFCANDVLSDSEHLKTEWLKDYIIYHAQLALADDRFLFETKMKLIEKLRKLSPGWDAQIFYNFKALEILAEEKPETAINPFYNIKASKKSFKQFDK